MSENNDSHTEEKIEDLIVLGGGPAGYTAALYAARAELDPLVIEGFQWGGQLQNTTDVENYPGYPEGIMGPEMMTQFRAQAERFGTRFVSDDATEVKLSDGGIHEVHVGKDLYRTRAIILSMGAEPKRLDIPGETELSGMGVSTCGVCDGAFFKGDDVAVIGGGDTAMEDSIFISKFAEKLTIIHGREVFRASPILVERARAKDNIEVLTPYKPLEFVAGDDGKIAKIKLENTETGDERGSSKGLTKHGANSFLTEIWTVAATVRDFTDTGQKHTVTPVTDRPAARGAGGGPNTAVRTVARGRSVPSRTSPFRRRR